MPNDHLVDKLDECLMIHIKVEQLAQQVVSKLLSNKYHSQRLPFSGGISLFSFGKSLAGVVDWKVQSSIRLCQMIPKAMLHTST